MGPNDTEVTRFARRQPRPHLRHHPARRGAVAGDLAERGREAGDRPAARAPRGRRDRGRLPDRLAGGLRGGQGDRPDGRRADHLRPGPHPQGGHRRRLGRGQIRRTPAHPHLHLDLRHPHQVPDGHRPRGRQGTGQGGGDDGQGLLRGRRVLADGRQPLGLRVHRRGAADRDRRRGDGDQRPRHGRLRDARGVRGDVAHLLRDGPGPAQGRDLGPLPRRPGAGRRQLLRRGHRRLPPGRVRDQRAGRAGRQLLAGGDRDADQGPRGRPRLHHRHQHPRDRPHQPPGQSHDRLPGAAEQGDRRPQRLRPRVGDPPGRRAEGAHHLRDHGRDRSRLRVQLDRPRQALRPPRAERRAGAAGLQDRGRAPSTPPSRRSRRSPTARSR